MNVLGQKKARPGSLEAGEGLHGLRAKVESFRKDVHKFSSELSQGVEDLRRSAGARPTVGAKSFRESLGKLQQRAEMASGEIKELEVKLAANPPLEELLSHCLAQLEDNGKRVESLEAHLRKFGLLAACSPVKLSSKTDQIVKNEDPLSQSLVKKGSRLRRSLSSPGVFSDQMLSPDLDSLGSVPLMTPSPAPSAMHSLGSVSPSLRELQAKYGAAPAFSGSPKGRTKTQFGSPTRGHSPQKGASPQKKISQRADMGSWITRKLQEKPSLPSSPATPASAVSLDSRQSSRQKNCNENTDTGNLIQAVRLSADDMRPPSTKLLTVQTLTKPPPFFSDTGSALSHQGNNTPLGKEDIINVRLANGEAPWDMLSLKAAINHAVPGTGDVQRVIESATFHPQAAAFTSLLHMCAKNKLWEKALEVFDGMKKHYADVNPNTVHFSSLISACGTAGRWKEAMQVFEEMKAHARKQPQCAPNVITFSALMTACCSGGRPDQAHAVFKDMIAQGIKPDHISYSTLIAGYERWGDMEKATQLFEEMRSAGLAQSLGPQSYLEQFSRKLRRSNSMMVEANDAGLRKLAASQKHWNNFGADMPDSPAIQAHFPVNLPLRNRSGDGMADDANALALRREILQERAGVSGSYGEMLNSPGPTQMTQPVMLTPQRTPMSHMRQSLPGSVSTLRGGGGSGRYRDIGRSPLSQSYDYNQAPLAHAGSLQGPPPGLISRNLIHSSSLDHVGSITEKIQRQLGSTDFSHIDFPADQVNQSLTSLPSGVNSAMLDAFVHHKMPSHMMTPGITPQAQQFANPSPGPTRAANGGPQMSQVSVDEYNNLPLRFSRQLSLDQMNEAVDYINAVVEGKHNGNPRASSSGGIETMGVIPTELIPLQYGIQRTTALLNCLLQLKRMRLCVRDEQQIYVLLA